MSALTIAVLVAASATVVRLFVPHRHRPRWSTALPFVALGLVAARLGLVGLDTEMLPLLVLTLVASVATTVSAVRRRSRRRAERSGPRSVAGRGTVGRIVGGLARLAAVALLTLGTTLAFALRSEAVVRGPVDLAPIGSARHGVTVIAEHAFLRTPRDLAFNPLRPDELWVVNGRDDSVAIVHDALSTSPRIEYRRDAKAAHFMHRPSALAFGAPDTTIGRPGTFATAQESMDDAVPFMRREFMGPTLFSSDLEVFARPVAPWLLGSHLDMLHESPLAMGIAWEREHVYWVFGGYLETITRYDFVEDHGVGHDDHSNGVIRHYGAGVVRREDGVPSHLAFHAPSAELFIADTGHRRVLALDTRSGNVGARGPGWEAGVDTRWVDGADYRVVVPEGRIERPSGLTLAGDHLLVGDHATGFVHVLTLAGDPVDTIDTGVGGGALMGLTIGPDGGLYAVDAAGGRVLHVATSVTETRRPAPVADSTVAPRGAQHDRTDRRHH